MLHNCKIENNSSVMVQMRNHPDFTFYLTGSRFFGNFRPDSDWDFFTIDSAEVRKWLEFFGFKKLHFTPYKDQLTQSVYRHYQYKIDVQLVQNDAIKLQAQNWIYSLWSLSSFKKKFMEASKQEKDLFWNFAFCAATGYLWGDGHSCNTLVIPDYNKLTEDFK